MALTSAALRHVGPGGITAEIGNPSPTVHTPEETGEYKRAALLIRRFHPVLLDLGLDRTLPPNWITPTADGGVSFGELSLRQVDQLILALEDVAGGRRTPLAQPSEGQLSLFGGDPQ
jgi:hypothetical protein